jgi:hypothetical protein
MNGEDIDQASKRQESRHLFLGCGEHHVTPGAPGLRSDER